ncbi:MAG: PKD domain-containing protein [Thermoplasmata archaeon]|nr:MAG: PKD domain-containing protein [Thermoplasmata archaeon]
MRRRSAIVQWAMMMLLACVLIVSMPLTATAGSDDAPSPPMDEVMDTTPPTAVAGDDILVLPEEGVYLNGSLSTDDVGIVKYEWFIVCNHGHASTWNGSVVGVAFHHLGVYNCTLTVWDAAGNFDKDHLIATVADLEPPVAVIGEDQVIDQHTTLDLNGSASTDNWLIVSWNWTITSPDDGTTHYDTKKITHTFDEAGVHTVTLRVTDPVDQRNETTINVTVLDITDPRASLGVDATVDQGQTIHLDGTSSWDNVGVVNWTWTVEGHGFNETHYGPEANHTFRHAGVFNVTLNVTDAAANWDTSNFTVTVRDTEAPVADAGDDVTVDEGTSVVLDANASTDNVGIDSYIWSFVYDGRERWLPSPTPTSTFTFHRPGIYTITLEVIDAMGNVGADQLTITVLDITPPVADAGEDMMVDQHTTVSFSAPGSSDNVAIVDVRWTFEYDGEERVLNGTGAEFTFDLPGVYNVTMMVSDAAGNTASDDFVITVEDTTVPVAVAGEDVLVKVGTAVRFDGSSSSDNVAIVGFSWTFDDDGETRTHSGPVLVVTYLVPGEYDVTLTVTDAAGNTGNDTLRVTVVDDQVPVAVAGDDITVDQGQRVDLDGSGSVDNVGVEGFTWTFTYDGEEISLLSATVAFTFHIPGSYAVTLSVQDGVGNVATDGLTITVRDTEAPVADAGEDARVDQHTTVALDGTASFDNVAITGWTWTLAHDGTDHVLHGSSTTFTFDVAGTYEVTLEVRDEEGNLASDSVMVTVNDITPPQAVSNMDTSVLMDEEVTLDGSGSTDNVGVVKWTWTLGTPDGPLMGTGETVNWTFQEPGEFQVHLTVIDGAGNEASVQGTIVVEDTSHDHRTPIWVYLVPIVLIAMMIVVVVTNLMRKGT